MHGPSAGALLLTGQTNSSPFSRAAITIAGRVFTPSPAPNGTGARITSPRINVPICQVPSGAGGHKAIARSPYVTAGKSKKRYMTRCDACKKNVPLPFRCPFCGKNFCDDHRLPPNHACTGLAEWKKTPAPGVGIRYGSSGTSSYGGGYAPSAPAKPRELPIWKRPAVRIALVAALLLLLVIIFVLHAACVQSAGPAGEAAGTANLTPALPATQVVPETTGTIVLNTTAMPASTTEVPVTATIKKTTLPTKTTPASRSPPLTPPPANASTDPYTISSMGLAGRIHELVNKERTANGLTALSEDDALAALALGHSTDMAANNYFSHTDLSGSDPTARGNASGILCRKDYGSYYTYGIAENLFQNNLYTSVTLTSGTYSYAWSTEEEIAQSTVTGWMNSPGHRKNILTSTYDREGIGVAVSADDKVYITEDFC